MARTYRRKHSVQECSVLTDSHFYHHPGGGWSWEHRFIDPRSPEGREALARFHSDRRYAGGPNKAFRRPYHHQERQAFRMDIHRWWQRDDHDFLSPINHRHSASWDWW